MQAVVRAVPRILSIECVEGTAGEVGSVIRTTTIQPDGTHVAQDHTVVKVGPPHSLVTSTQLPHAVATAHHEFIPLDHNTEYRVALTLETEPVPWHERALLRLTQRRRRKAAHADFTYELDCKNAYLGKSSH